MSNVLKSAGLASANASGKETGALAAPAFARLPYPPNARLSKPYGLSFVTEVRTVRGRWLETRLFDVPARAPCKPLAQHLLDSEALGIDAAEELLRVLNTEMQAGANDPDQTQPVRARLAEILSEVFAVSLNHKDPRQHAAAAFRNIMMDVLSVGLGWACLDLLVARHRRLSEEDAKTLAGFEERGRANFIERMHAAKAAQRQAKGSAANEVAA